MLPQRRAQDDGVGTGPVESRMRPHDDGMDLLDAVTQDLMAGLEKKDKARIRGALEALCTYIQTQDEIQDEGMTP